MPKLPEKIILMGFDQPMADALARRIVAETAAPPEGPRDDNGDPVCPDHGPLVDGRCYECEHNELLVDTEQERRAFGDSR
jgi:hypothetical protein